MTLEQIKKQLTKTKKELKEASALRAKGTMDNKFVDKWIENYRARLSELETQRLELENKARKRK